MIDEEFKQLKRSYFLRVESCKKRWEYAMAKAAEANQAVMYEKTRLDAAEFDYNKLEATPPEPK